MELTTAGGSDSGPRVFEEPHFRHLLELEVGRCIRYQDFLCLCLIRVEQPINPPSWCRDAVAEKLAELFRSTDIVGIIGDDVCTLLLHTSGADSASVIDRVRQTVEAIPFLPVAGGAPVHIMIKTSAVSFPADATTATLLLSRSQAHFESLL